MNIGGYEQTEEDPIDDYEVDSQGENNFSQSGEEGSSESEDMTEDWWNQPGSQSD
jgi:hypothetical protein